MNQSKTILIYRLRLKLTDLLECIKIHISISVTEELINLLIVKRVFAKRIKFFRNHEQTLKFCVRVCII